MSFATSANGSSTSRQDYDAWGVVRSGGVSATNLNYTGQRLDSTGLLDYHARLYDPALARFVSADSIAPKHEDPQTRNRYSYVLNNPLRFTDPTGHCTEGTIDDPKECARVRDTLAEYGIAVDIERWRYYELSLVLKGIIELATVANWSPADFRSAVTGNGEYTVSIDWIHTRRRDGVQGETAQPKNGHIAMYLYDNAFIDQDTAKAVTVHEVAHVIDNATSGELSRDMMAATGSSYASDLHQRSYDYAGSPASLYGGKNHKEDWAETVAASVYPGYPDYRDKKLDKARQNYMNNTFCAYSSTCSPVINK